MKKTIILILTFILSSLTVMGVSTIQWNLTMDDSDDFFGVSGCTFNGNMTCSGAGATAAVVHQAINLSENDGESHTFELVANFPTTWLGGRRGMIFHSRNTTAQLIPNWDIGSTSGSDIAVRGSTELEIQTQQVNHFNLIKITTHANKTIDIFINNTKLGTINNFQSGADVSNASWLLFNLDDTGSMIVDWIAHYNGTTTDVGPPPNTPPSTPTIINPTATAHNTIPLDLQVTFPPDADADPITINYYINGTLNSSSDSNSTLNASDGVYLLEVELNDGTDSSSNASVTFSIDTVNPILTITSP